VERQQILLAEHLVLSHPILSVTLSKLFNLILLCQHAPSAFKYSYIVLVPKIKDHRDKVMACNDSRAIAISPILSKVFEYCIVERFSHLLRTGDTQFGLRKVWVVIMLLIQYGMLLINLFAIVVL